MQDIQKAPEQVLIVGGSSGMGLSLAATLLAEGTRVTIAGRTQERLDEARKQLPQSSLLSTVVADITQEGEVIELFAQTGPLDHIVTTAATLDGVYRLLPELELPAIRRAIDSKLLGPLLLAKYGAPSLSSHGSITFTSGIAAYRPAARGSVVAAVNGALASLAYALAIELAPVRVNVVSPGWVDSPIWAAVAGDKKAEMLGAMAERLPVGRVGQPADIAQAIQFLMRNGFATGTVLHVDGGHRLV
jgi:NAD(P)-dependent dehydrogenase (short-subunit alcohol dehydrogenase family)